MQGIRRKKIEDKMKSKSILLLYSGREINASGDNNYPFYLDRDFYYFTNIKQDNSYLLIYKKNKNEIKEYLFIDKFNEKKEKWFGKKISRDYAINESKIKDVLYTEDLLKFLGDLVKKVKYFYYDSNSRFENVKAIIYSLKKTNNFIDLDIFNRIRELRILKDESEINNIKKAIDITYESLKESIKTCKNAKYEYEVYNSFNAAALNRGTHELGFHSIVASGKNATCLHYPAPYDAIKKGSLILNDVGAAYNFYSADITRTYPTNGKFSDLQKSIYEIVLNANKTVIKNIKPGLSLLDLQEICKKVLFNGLKKVNLVKEFKDLKKYYYHGVSHQVGLDVHDVTYSRKEKLRPGMVITVEPGLYIKEYEIGIRIEDDVLVTKDSHEVLSKNIVKEVEDIEKLYKECK